MNLKQALILGFVISLVLVLVNSFLYFHTMSSYNDVSMTEDLSETVYGDDIAITFLSTKPLYRSGENLNFQIHIDNQGEEFISNINFIINVRYSSIFDVKIFSKDHYSDRGFNGSTIDIIRIGSKGHMGVALPSITPSGIYELELVATPENKDTLPPAKVRMFVVQSPFYLYLYTFSTILFFSLYGTLIAYEELVKGRKIETRKVFMERKIEFRKVILKPFYFFLLIVGKFIFSVSYWIRITFYRMVERALPLINELQELYEKLKVAILNFSIGQKFVFVGICLILSTAISLSIGLPDLANDIAILAYNSLVIGVINILFENLQEQRESKISLNVTFLSRVNFSLLVFILLIYFSISELGITISLLSVLMLIVIRRMF